MTQSTITLGSGCFWCTDAIFSRVKGVTHVECGYSNGNTSTQPSYEDVCTGKTGYAEVLRIDYDTSIISTSQILEIFFFTHDATSLNRQGEDVGTQYRSAIYVETDEQRDIANSMIEKINATGVLGKAIVTEVDSLQNFWRAEEYHQDYFAHHPEQAYCAAVIGPKVRKFEQTLKQFLQT